MTEAPVNEAEQSLAQTTLQLTQSIKDLVGDREDTWIQDEKGGNLRVQQAREESKPEDTIIVTRTLPAVTALVSYMTVQVSETNVITPTGVTRVTEKQFHSRGELDDADRGNKKFQKEEVLDEAATQRFKLLFDNATVIRIGS